MAGDTPVAIRRIDPPELGCPPSTRRLWTYVSAGSFFIAGQTALDSDGNVVGKNDFAAQAEQVFHNLSVALQSAGCTAANLVKLTVFLRDIGQLSIPRSAQSFLRDRLAAGSACGHSCGSV